MPKRNIELLTKIRDLIAAEPKKLDMYSWSKFLPEQVGNLGYDSKVKLDCGTTQCIAGWAVQMSGWKFLVFGDEVDYDDDDNEVYFADTCVAKNGRTALVEDKARDLLGLTNEESTYLFTRVGNNDAVNALDLFIDGAPLREIQRAIGYW